MNAPRSVWEIPEGVPVFLRAEGVSYDRRMVYACPDEYWQANFGAWQKFCARARAAGLESVAHIPEPFPAGHIIFEGRCSDWVKLDVRKPLRECTADEINFRMARRCSFAFPGTYGHECGRPGVKVGVKRTETGTRSGLYYAVRCEQCASIAGGENAGVMRWEPFDPIVHVNEWRR